MGGFSWNDSALPPTALTAKNLMKLRRFNKARSSFFSIEFSSQNLIHKNFFHYSGSFYTYSIGDF
jgi:hypothetical protein